MSKVIAAEELAGCEPWQLPEVEQPGSASPRPGAGPGPMTAAQLEALQQAAYEEGFAQGLRDGRAAGEQEVRAEAQRLAAALDRLAQPLERVDEQVEQELVALAIAIARQLIRRELSTSPGEIVPVVREALAALPAASREVRVHLHPDDVALIHEALPAGDGGERPWRVVEDGLISRGGCRVEAEHSRIDATLEKRLTSVVTAVLGGEREGDGAGD